MTEAPPQRILLVQLHYLGDVILATPTIRATRAAFPNARIDFLTGPLGAQVLAGNAHLDNIIVQPLLRQLYASNYDVAADMHSVPRSALYVAATRARTRVGLRGRGPRNLAYTQLLPRERGRVYIARQKLRLVAPLGVTSEDVKLEIAIDDSAREWAAKILQQLTPPIIAISPVALHDYKQWGADRFAAVADALSGSVLITSGPGERDQAEAVAAKMKRAALWDHGPTTIAQLAALYERCALWIGNDGGPKHVAVAVGTPTVSIIRGELGPIWNDANDDKQVFLQADSGLLADIRPDAVIAASSALLT